MKWYGILEENYNIFFVIDGFYCLLMNSKETITEAVTLVQRDGFLLGKVLGGTKTENYVYIYVGKDIQIRKNFGINTGLYITSNSPKLDKFQAITFKGGVLNKLLNHSQWDIPEREDGRLSIVTNLSENHLTYSLTNSKLGGKISISAGICESMSLEKGSSLSTTSTELDILFENEKSIGSFDEIFGDVLNLCQFMVFRKNVYFEEILLKVNQDDPLDFYRNYAVCHKKFEGNAAINKGLFHCITFNFLGEHVDNLLNFIITSKEEKTGFNIGFLPQEDDDALLFTGMRIREIISALEAELKANGVETQADKEFNQLINSLKEMVKNHRDGAKPLNDPKDYDNIFGTLDHMQGSLKNRIQKFVKDYHSLSGRWLGNEQISDIVAFRNETTHGKVSSLSPELADTAYVLMELIYCSILKRAGVEEDVIKDLMKRHILN